MFKLQPSNPSKSNHIGHSAPHSKCPSKSVEVVGFEESSTSDFHDRTRVGHANNVFINHNLSLNYS